MSGLPSYYFVAPDANDDLWVWRGCECGDHPLPVLRQVHDGPLWDAIVGLVGEAS